MSGEGLVCWRCGADLSAIEPPFGRREACPSCRAELHVCRMCAFFDPAAPNRCREPVAEPVRDPERANFCGYLTPRPGAHRPDESAVAARARAEALFGGPVPKENAPEDPGAALRRLFGEE